MSVDNELSRSGADRQTRETVQTPPPPTQKLHLTPEELRVLDECNKESFFYRSVPLAAVAMAATQFAVHKGLLKPHPRWGSVLKLLGVGFASWFIGKFSYQSACEEKFLRLKNSPVADMIRKRKGITPQPFEEHPPSGEMLYADDSTSYSVEDDFMSSSRSLNLDTDKNIQYAGLDDSDRFKGEYGAQPEDKPQKFTTTYDDLRRKNREEYELRQSKLFAPSTPSYMPPFSSSKDWRSHEDITPGSNHQENPSVLQNMYGDRWDK